LKAKTQCQEWFVYWIVIIVN